MQDVIGFIGLGTMGSPMAANIAAGGYDLRLFDVDLERAAELAGTIGGTAVEDARLLADCGVIVLMLPTSAIVRSALLDDEDELRIPLRPGTVVVDMSSSDPTETVATGKVLARQGIDLVDAPVSGARERAQSGTLTIMLGADQDAAANRALPVIETMSSHIYRTGGLGTGHAMKALNNFVAGAAFVASSEALITGAEFGLDRQLMLDVLNDSTGQTFSSSHVLGPHVVDRQYASGFALPLLTKDVRIARRLQRAMNKSGAVCDATTASLEQALEALGAVDHTRAYVFWEER